MKTLKGLRKKVYHIIEASDDHRGISWYFDMFLIILIALNVIAIILESLEPLNDKYNTFFYKFEVFSVAFFTIEYVLRVWTAIENERYNQSFTGRMKFILTPMAMIDLLAILPFYLATILDLRFVRILRLFRIFRIFKVMRYSSAILIIGKVLRKKSEQLVLSIIFILFLLLLASCTMYYVEHPAQPDIFSSIPETMWWSVSTLTTVGYGDIYPITPMGQFLGGIIAILGVGLFALPAGILAAGFSEAVEEPKKPANYCSNCGHKLNS